VGSQRDLAVAFGKELGRVARVASCRARCSDRRVRPEHANNPSLAHSTSAETDCEGRPLRDALHRSIRSMRSREHARRRITGNVPNRRRIHVTRRRVEVEHPSHARGTHFRKGDRPALRALARTGGAVGRALKVGYSLAGRREARPTSTRHNGVGSRDERIPRKLDLNLREGPSDVVRAVIGGARQNEIESRDRIDRDGRV